MNRRTFLLCTILVVAMPAPVLSAPSIAPQLRSVPGAQQVGRGRLRVLLVPVLDATLYSPEGRWQADGPAAIKVEYLTSLSGAGMAKHAVEQMRTVGVSDEARLVAWQKRMESIFPDVTPGTCVYAVRDARGETTFYRGETRLGSINDPQFSAALFDICLSPRTSQPDLRRHLLGKA